ncbi:mandelate racemase/muconate lactonizing enzyme family protein [Halegenticoccus tardaugens]|uniref:mandelate racemase/muconate lactonizing enzyme family protein n=1 Tax=Halegenticoccus tardaugens TaxID=2071624 RepID=UPI00100B4D74|nr:mandelate racemase/muconate lactonizing enzyme family protein [Halegenticoccus tardaugens]
MQIESIDVYQVDLPYSGGVYHLSGGRTYSEFDATVVRLVTDDGLEGWGESTPFGPNYIAAHARGVRAGIEEMADSLLGCDPRHVDRVNETMDRSLVGHNHAKTAIDVACWDLFGKAVDMPVCDLLGGSTNASMNLISSIHAGDPEDMRQRVAEYRDRGYKGHSVKIGAPQSEGGPSLDATRIEQALADAENDEFYIVDGNGGLAAEHMLRVLNLVPSGLDFVLENPCETWRENLSLRRRSNIPMFFDELADGDEAIIRAIADDAVDGIGLKISTSGGLTRGRRHRDMCLAAGLPVSVQATTGSEIAFAALAHLGQTVPPDMLRCVLDSSDMVTTQIAEFDANVSNGEATVSETPGLGIQVDRSVLGEPTASYS